MPRLIDLSDCRYEKRERPHIVWNEAMEPTWLVTGAVLPSGQQGYSGPSFTLVQQVLA